MINPWLVVKDFKIGDPVQRLSLDGRSLSPFLGRVTSVQPGLGTVGVQWPTGNERLSSEYLVRVNPELSLWLPPELDQSYSSYDTETSRKKISSGRNLPTWKGSSVPGFYRSLCAFWLNGETEVGAYDQLWRSVTASGMDDFTLRSEISKFYRMGQKLADSRLMSHIKRTAVYWAAQNRRYRITRTELASGKPNCPRCGSPMRRAVYKMLEGGKIRLFACPKDLYLLKSSDILGPDGEAVAW